MTKVDRNKSLDKKLKLVEDSREIKREYYHLASKEYYVFTLDKNSIKDINYFIKKKLIFIKK